MAITFPVVYTGGPEPLVTHLLGVPSTIYDTCIAPTGVWAVEALVKESICLILCEASVAVGTLGFVH